MGEIKIGEEFKPSPRFRNLYFIYFAFGLLIGVLTWYIPILAYAPAGVSLVISIFILPIILLIALWIPKYCNSIAYKLTKDEIIWRRGVWFKMTGIVPYNRITNIDIIQGPISRVLGIASLRIQTAGYSGQKSRAEIKLDGIEKFEELRDIILKFVKGRRPVATEVYEEEAIDAKILDELVKIRKLLEKSVKKRPRKRA
ncbi:MAG: PH domain-containing protein [Thaumarchaeota archaeon]|nr:PH domain-containing protein [Nitrososphaerota archaeon]